MNNRNGPMPSSPEPEKRRIKVSYGDLPASKISILATCHPFSQQLDVVFPSTPGLLEVLQKLETSYWKGKTRLSDVVDHAEALVNSAQVQSNLLVLSVNTHDEDVWCIDPRSHLTLSLSKDTYERLGLVGHKLPFRAHSEIHVVDIPFMKKGQGSIGQKATLERWDQMRLDELGSEHGLWDVVYCSANPNATPSVPFQGHQHELKRVKCTKKEMFNIYIPTLPLSPIPEASKSSSNSVEEELENWSNQVQNLFEWVGMACLGAQRLYANDRVDPYIALYESPTPSSVGNTTHLRWRGLLSPDFVQQVLDAVISQVQQTSKKGPNFVGITAHALSNSPVSYISPAPIGSGRASMKLPRGDAEDTWSLLLEHPERDDANHVRWCLMESLGLWDTRWG